MLLFTSFFSLSINDKMTSNFVNFGEYIGNTYKYVEPQDWYPFHNQWRGQPLDPNHAYIRSNIAGLYPYKREMNEIKQAPEPEWKYAWYFPCNTIFPSNPQFLRDRAIIMER